MLLVLKRTVSMRRFFWVPRIYVKLMGKKIFTLQFYAYFLSKPIRLGFEIGFPQDVGNEIKMRKPFSINFQLALYNLNYIIFGHVDSTFHFSFLLFRGEKS